MLLARRAPLSCEGMSCKSRSNLISQCFVIAPRFNVAHPGAAVFTKCAVFLIIRIEQHGCRIDCVGISMPGSIFTGAGGLIQQDNKVTYVEDFSSTSFSLAVVVFATGIFFFFISLDDILQKPKHEYKVRPPRSSDQQLWDRHILYLKRMRQPCQYRDTDSLPQRESAVHWHCLWRDGVQPKDGTTDRLQVSDQDAIRHFI